MLVFRNIVCLKLFVSFNLLQFVFLFFDQREHNTMMMPDAYFVRRNFFLHIRTLFICMKHETITQNKSNYIYVNGADFYL